MKKAVYHPGSVIASLHLKIFSESLFPVAFIPFFERANCIDHLAFFQEVVAGVWVESTLALEKQKELEYHSSAQLHCFYKVHMEFHW